MSRISTKMAVETGANRTQANAPTWIKALVAIHVVCIVIWATPNPTDAVAQGLREPTIADRYVMWNARTLKSSPPIQAYVFTTATWQYWDMFAPDPSNTDFYCDAEVIRRDGTVEKYQYPRIKLLPLPQKYIMERYRKFFERAHLEQNSYIWPQFARRIAAITDTSPQNPPVRVRLFRHWLPIAPPGKVQQPDYNQYMYFEYLVSPADLEAAKKERLW